MKKSFNKQLHAYRFESIRFYYQNASKEAIYHQGLAFRNINQLLIAW
jgi:hypothetical protein